MSDDQPNQSNESAAERVAASIEQETVLWRNLTMFNEEMPPPTGEAIPGGIRQPPPEPPAATSTPEAAPPPPQATDE
jgi:hypothetical protein